MLGIAHKTEAGGVKLTLRREDTMRKAYREIIEMNRLIIEEKEELEIVNRDTEVAAIVVYHGELPAIRR